MPASQIIMVAGDVNPPALALLTDSAGNAINLGLPGTTIRFRLINFHTRAVRIDAQATSLQDNNVFNTFGQVVYYWQPQDTTDPGLYIARFVYDAGNGPQSLPPDDSYFVLINP